MNRRLAVARTLLLAAAPAVLLTVALVPVWAQATASTTIRVGILREQERVVIMSDQAMEVLAGSFTRYVLERGAYEVTPLPQGIDIVGLGRVEAPLRVIPTGGARLHVPIPGASVRPYRGIIEIRRTPSGRLTVINELDLEEYLYGVLKMEVDPRWPPDALMAQAVAARTLALYSLNRFGAEGYDVRATTDSQVYGGVAAEDPRTTAAVDATRGQILAYQGRPIFAAYHSDSGGYTEASEYVWGGTYPYLRAVADPYTAAQPWTLRQDLSALEDRLRRGGKPASGITAIEVTDFTPSGRAGTVRITSAAGTVTLRATELRTLLGAEALRSTFFSVRLTPDEQPAVEFTGRGAGHGVGLSQWGSRGMALVGKGYVEILRYYYTGISIEGR